MNRNEAAANWALQEMSTVPAWQRPAPIRARRASLPVRVLRTILGAVGIEA